MMFRISRFAQAATCLRALEAQVFVGIHDQNATHKIGETGFDQQRHHDETVSGAQCLCPRCHLGADTRVQDGFEAPAFGDCRK